jgi:predicted enzyme related to lactoylglutathione lyase
MIKLDHLVISVRDQHVARDWYVERLGLKVEFEVPERSTCALQDDAGFTLFVERTPAAVVPETVLYFQVDDVDAAYARLAAAGVKFAHAPQRVFWGYGAELTDPDGHRVRLWDEVSMRDRAAAVERAP